MLNVFTTGTDKSFADDVLEFEELPKVEINVNPVEGSSFTLTDDDLYEGVEIDRYTQSGEALEIGTASSAECRFTIENYNGEFSDIMFEGAEIEVYFVFSNTNYSSTPRRVRLGRFTVDEKPRMNRLIRISALDDMVKFDRIAPDDFSLDGKTVSAAYSYICSACHVSFSSNIIFEVPEEFRSRTIYMDTDYSDRQNLTYRQYLMWILQLIGANAYMDCNNFLKTRWYSDQYPSKTSQKDTDLKTIDADKRFVTSSIEEKYVGVSSLVLGEFRAGRDYTSNPTDTDYFLEFDLSENPYAASFYRSQADLQILFNNRFEDFRYLPFSAETVPLIWLEPLDRVYFKTAEGDIYDTFISHITINSSGNMKIEIKGESKTKTGYASLNPLTAQERKILDNIRNGMNQQVTEYENSLIEFNKAVNAGMGLHTTTYNGVDYYHDSETLGASSYVVKASGAGIAWTDDGIELDESGEDITTWKYGFSKNGTAILGNLQAYRVNADLITCNDLSAINATIAGWNMTENQLYSDYGRYRAFIQNAQAAGADSWIFSTQYKNSSGTYEPRFMATARGEVYAYNKIETDTRYYSNNTCNNYHTGLWHSYKDTSNNTVVAKFGVDELANEFGTAVSLYLSDSSNITDESYFVKLGIAQAKYASDTVVLRTVTSTGNPSYIAIGTNAVYFQKSYGTYDSNISNMLSLYCRDVYFSNQSLSLVALYNTVNTTVKSWINTIISVVNNNANVLSSGSGSVSKISNSWN